MEEIIVVSAPMERKTMMDRGRSALRTVAILWQEITSGVGFWGSFRPILAVMLSLVPFLFLGYHFNRKHRQAFDFTALQIPLALTVVLWVGLYVFSIFEAYRDATIIVAEAARRHAAGSQSWVSDAGTRARSGG